MANKKNSLWENLGTDLLPFVIMGIGIAMLVWLFGFGDLFI